MKLKPRLNEVLSIGFYIFRLYTRVYAVVGYSDKKKRFIETYRVDAESFEVLERCDKTGFALERNIDPATKTELGVAPVRMEFPIKTHDEKAFEIIKKHVS